MATKKIEIQDHQGNVYHPHTDANVVYMPDGKTVKEALESLKLSVSNGKSSIATAITGKGVAASGNDSFSTLSTKIGQISTGKKWASGQSKVSGRRRFDTFSGDGEYKTIDITNVGFKPNFITRDRLIELATRFSNNSYLKEILSWKWINKWYSKIIILYLN